jgi:hypothetical protein
MPVAQVRPESVKHILASAGVADTAPSRIAQAIDVDLM